MPGAAAGTRARLVALDESQPIAEDAETQRLMDRVMTVEEYNACKKLVGKTLRNKGDPPPRIMAHGQGCILAQCATVSALLAQRPGARLVRGYKLHTVPLSQYGEPEADGIKATFHMVLATPSRADPGRDVYECACKAYNPSDQDKPFVFVPSSRAHSQIPDDELLRNWWIVGCVVFGNLSWADTLCSTQRVAGRRQSVIGTTPETCVSKRHWGVRLHPCFQEWYADRKPQRHPGDDLQSFAELFGFPVFCVGDDSWRGRDYWALQRGIADNDAAIVPGNETLLLISRVKWQVCTLEITQEEARALIFEHYDARLAIALEQYQTSLSGAVNANHL